MYKVRDGRMQTKSEKLIFDFIVEILWSMETERHLSLFTWKWHYKTLWNECLLNFMMNSHYMVSSTKRDGRTEILWRTYSIDQIIKGF